MNQKDFEDACAMLAMVGIIIRGNILSNKAEDAREAFAIAKHMSKVRNQELEPESEVEMGIVAAKPKRKTKSA
jgi:hypothetical protein